MTKSLNHAFFLLLMILIIGSGCSKTEETKDPFYSPPPQADPFITAFVSDLNADSISAYTTHNKEGDSYNFFLRGYPALFLISFSSTPHYHTLQDVIGNCNFNYCREVTKLSCAILLEQNK